MSKAIGVSAAGGGGAGSNVTVVNGAGASAVNIQDGGNSITVDGTVTADTELPAATALADADPNPTTSRIGSNLLGYNGATWDRLRSTIANGLVVDVSRVQGTVAVTQSTSPWVVSGTVAVSNFPATQPVSGTVTADTELPAATALADADPNPTTSRIGSNLLGYNGTTWDRLRSTIANGLVVDVSRVQGTVAVTQSTSPWVVSGTVTTNTERAEDSGHTSGDKGQFILAVRNDAGTSLVDTTLDYAPLQVNSVGELRVTTSGGTPSGRDDTDNQAPVATGLNTGVSRTYVYDTVGTNWDRWTGLVTVGNAAGASAVNIQDGGNSITVDGTVAVSNFPATQPVSGTVTADTELPAASALADADPNPTTSRVGSNLLGFNGTTWDRLRSGGDNADNEAGTTLGALLTKSRMYVWDSVGANWDRWTGAVTGSLSLVGTDTAADAHANPTTALIADSYNSVFNGTTWDRWRSAPGVTGSGAVGGPTAAGSAVAVAPQTIGGRTSIAAPTETASDGNVQNVWLTRAGAQRVYPSRRRRTGIYAASLGSSTVTAAADAATAGRFWLQNPVGATVFAAIRRVYFSMSTTTGLLAITAPVFTIERFTFTGVASGAAITPAKRDTNDATATAIIRTASTGMTITAGAAAHGFQVPSALATTSASTAQQLWPASADEDEYLILRAGEGIVIRQATAGTALDTRICNFDILWEEFNSTDFVVRD